MYRFDHRMGGKPAAAPRHRARWQSAIQTRKRILLASAASFVIVSAADTAHAVSWIGPSGFWADATKWSDGAVPSPAEQVDLRFNDATSRTVQFNFNYASPIGAFRIDQTGTGTTTFLLPGGNLSSGPLTVGQSGAAAFVQLAGTNTASSGTLGSSFSAFGTYTISGGAFNVTNELVVGGGGNGVLNVGTAGTVSVGSLSLGKGSDPGTSGTVTLSNGGVITVGGETIVGGMFGTTVGGLGRFVHSGGINNTTTLSIGRYSEGVGSYVLSGGTLNVTNATTLGDVININSRGQFAQSGGAHNTGSLNLIGGSNAIVGSTYAMSGGTLTVTGTLSVSVSVSNPVTTTFTHSGGAVSALSLRVDNPGAFYTMTGAGATLAASSIVVSDGARFTLAGAVNTGSLTVSSATLQLNGANVATGMIFQNGTLSTFGATSHIASATLGLDSSNTIGTTLNVTDTLSNPLGVPIFGAGTLGTTSTGRIVGRGQIFPRINNTGTLIADSGDLILTNANTVNSGTLEAGPNASLFVNSASLTHTGNIRIAGGGAVVLSAPITNGSGKQIVLLGGHLAAPAITNALGGTIQGFGQITADLVNSGTAVFNAPTQLVGDLTNTATGRITVRNDKLIVTGNGTNAGTIVTSNGTIIFDGGVIAGPSAAGAVTISPGGGAVASYFRGQSLNIDGAPGNPGLAIVRAVAFGGETGVLNSLSMRGDTNNWLGKLDLADTDLVIDYASASPLARIQNQIKQGFSNGKWTGTGIVSSAADATRGLGYADNTLLGLASFSGQSIDPTSVLIKYTFYGDTNLDGQVDITDLGNLATNWQSSNVWTGGDSNYDGFVDITDLGMLATNWQAGVGNPLKPTDSPWALAEALGLPGGAVPEPACAAALALLVLARRRK